MWLANHGVEMAAVAAEVVWWFGGGRDKGKGGKMGGN